WSAGPRLNIPGGAFEFSPDGQLLAVSTKQGQLYLFDLEGERELAHFEDPELRFGNLTFSPDGSRLIAVHGNGVHVRDLRRDPGRLGRDGPGVAPLPMPGPGKATAGRRAAQARSESEQIAASGRPAGRGLRRP